MVYHDDESRRPRRHISVLALLRWAPFLLRLFEDWIDWGLL